VPGWALTTPAPRRASAPGPDDPLVAELIRLYDGEQLSLEIIAGVQLLPLVPADLPHPARGQPPVKTAMAPAEFVPRRTPSAVAAQGCASI